MQAEEAGTFIYTVNQHKTLVLHSADCKFKRAQDMIRLKGLAMTSLRNVWRELPTEQYITQMSE